MTKLQLYRPLSDAEPNMAEDSATGQFYWAADADAEIEALKLERHQLRNELTAARLEKDQLRAAMKIAQQAILEFSHAQQCGPSWYTRGENGMYQQVSMWLRRGSEAVRNALGPYDDDGQYLKEKPANEPSEVYDKIGVLRPDGELTTYEGCEGEPVYVRRALKSLEQQDVNPGSHKAAEVSQPENATPPRALLRPDNDWADVKSGLPDNTL